MASILFRTPCEQNNSRSTQLQSQNDVLILTSVDLFVIAITQTVSPELTYPNLTSKTQENLRSSILTSVHLPTCNRKRLVDKRVAVDITNSPVQDSRIRARAQNQLRRLGRPVPIVLRDSQAVADTNDLVGPIAARTFDFERTRGGLGAVDVGEEDGFGAVVEDELSGDGVGGGGREC
jgi:hypothetical protein